MKAVVAGRIVVLVDDSIVRGTTAKQLISLMKSAGMHHLFNSLIRNEEKKVPFNVFTFLIKQLFYKKCTYIKWTMCIGAKEGHLRACGHLCNVHRRERRALARGIAVGHRPKP
jgi:hypothetical protein